MAQIVKNKVSIYLIKDRYKTEGEILKNPEDLLEIPLTDVEGSFYYAKSGAYQPRWIKKFFNDSLRDAVDLYSASANGLLLVKVSCNGKKRFFAISFGHGWQFLKPYVAEERFGLKIVLNIIGPGSLHKIDKKNMGSLPKDATEQLSKIGSAADFGIDIEQDLVRSITAKTDDERFGKTVTGKDSFSASAPVHLSILDRFLQNIYERYTSDDYKENFGWIDQVAEIKDENLINKLDDTMISMIRSGGQNGKVWLAVPDIVEWHNIKGFSYLNSSADVYDDINLPDFLRSLNAEERKHLSTDILYNKTIQAFDTSDRVKNQWSAYGCLYCEVTLDKQTYILSNNKWYLIEKEFADGVNLAFSKALQSSAFTLPKYSHKDENAYNSDIPNTSKGFHCLDRQIIRHGGGHGQIEFCDLIQDNGTIIHVKRYGGSNVLSHLFAQGSVSAELMLADESFRVKVNDLLPDNLKFKNLEVRPTAKDYKIVFAIISDSEGDLEIPFFSKVNFRNTKRKLETFGFPVFITKVEVDKQPNADQKA